MSDNTHSRHLFNNTTTTTTTTIHPKLQPQQHLQHPTTIINRTFTEQRGRDSNPGDPWRSGRWVSPDNSNCYCRIQYFKCIPALCSFLFLLWSPSFCRYVSILLIADAFVVVFSCFLSSVSPNNLYFYWTYIICVLYFVWQLCFRDSLCKYI